MVVEAAPPAPFIITEAEFLLELLVIALDPPAQLWQVDQPIEGDILGQGGEPILGRLGFAFRPLDQQPLLGARLGSAWCRDARAAPAGGQSARTAAPRCPRAR